MLTLPAVTRDGAVHVVVESPRGSRSKFKYDPDLDVITLSRPLPDGFAYPHDWGFVPGTRAEDGDPLDAIIVWDGVTYPGIVVACRPIGVLEVEQNGKRSGERERNDRIAVLPVDALRWDSIDEVADLGDRFQEELAHFFAASVAFEGKELRLLGWKGRREAMALVEASQRRTARSRRRR